MIPKYVLIASFFVVAACKGQAVIELVPDPPPPHLPGQVLTLHVYAHSQIPFDRYIKIVQLDFTESHPALTLGPDFVFDLSAAGKPDDFVTSPALPVPWTKNLFEYGCDPCFLYLPGNGTLHLGSTSVELPGQAGVYRVDVFNAAIGDPSFGATLGLLGGERWRAYDGELTDGRYVFFVGVEQGVPAISDWGTTVMLIGLGIVGTLIVRKRRLACSLASLGMSLFLSSASVAQSVEVIDVEIDSGILSGWTLSESGAVVWSHQVSLPGAPWIRLHLSHAEIGQCLLRITSLTEGSVQTLDQAALEQWNYSSAYLKGDEILVELVAYSASEEIQIVIDRVMTGSASSGGAESLLDVCGEDDRQLSTDPRSSRLRYYITVDTNQCTREEVCTAFLFEDRPNSFLTAGHCFENMDFTCSFKPIVEFNVPMSEEDGTINPADPDDQYAVDPMSVQFDDDWAVFGVWRNSNTSLCPLAAQGDCYTLAESVPDANGSSLRVTGFGRDNIPIGVSGGLNDHSFVQQAATGTYQGRTATQIAHGVDTDGGNSGSAVEHVSSSLVYAIHTFGDCDNTASLDPGGDNGGTRIDNPYLQAALEVFPGVLMDCDEDGIPMGCDSSEIAQLGACCLSHTAGDCIRTTQCWCSEHGIWFYGAGSKCSLVNCVTAPSFGP